MYERPKSIGSQAWSRVARLRYMVPFSIYFLSCSKYWLLPLVRSRRHKKNTDLGTLHVRLAALVSAERLSLLMEYGAQHNAQFSIQAYTLFQRASPHRSFQNSATSSLIYGASRCRAESWQVFGMLEGVSRPCMPSTSSDCARLRSSVAPC